MDVTTQFDGVEGLLRLLVVEDSEDDTYLLVNELRRNGYEIHYERVETSVALHAALDKQGWHIILCDYRMPQFSALKALEILKERVPDLPVIIVTGAIGEDLAVEAMKAGAHDYVMKDNPARLIPAIERELSEAKVRRAKIRVEKTLKYKEQYLQAVIDNVLDAIITINESGLILSFNAAAERIFGYKEAEVLEKNVKMLMPEPQRSEHDSYLQNYFRGDSKILGVRRELVGRRKDGSTFPLDLGLTEMFLDEDRMFVGTLRDITERKSMEEELKAHTAELERSNRELQDFAYIASHDLQEPLRKVTTFGDRISELYGDLLEERGKDYLQRMQKATRRMRLLIDDLLAFSRVSTKAKPFRPTDLESVILKVLSDLEHQIERTGARVIIKHLPTVEADESQMYQLFQNLVSNALKFCKEGETPYVTINSAKTRDGRIEIIIKDNGIGFDEKYANQIFKPFERLHGRDEYEGTGIGLTICQRIVSRHGGTLSAKSAPQKGSAFIVKLPEKQRKSVT